MNLKLENNEMPIASHHRKPMEMQESSESYKMIMTERYVFAEIIFEIEETLMKLPQLQDASITMTRFTEYANCLVIYTGIIAYDSIRFFFLLLRHKNDA